MPSASERSLLGTQGEELRPARQVVFRLAYGGDAPTQMPSPLPVGTSGGGAGGAAAATRHPRTGSPKNAPTFADLDLAAVRSAVLAAIDEHGNSGRKHRVSSQSAPAPRVHVSKDGVARELVVTVAAATNADGKPIAYSRVGEAASLEAHADLLLRAVRGAGFVDTVASGLGFHLPLSAHPQLADGPLLSDGNRPPPQLHRPPALLTEWGAGEILPTPSSTSVPGSDAEDLLLYEGGLDAGNETAFDDSAGASGAGGGSGGADDGSWSAALGRLVGGDLWAWRAPRAGDAVTAHGLEILPRSTGHGGLSGGIVPASFLVALCSAFVLLWRYQSRRRKPSSASRLAPVFAGELERGMVRELPTPCKGGTTPPPRAAPPGSCSSASPISPDEIWATSVFIEPEPTRVAGATPNRGGLAGSGQRRGDGREEAKLLKRRVRWQL